jgi:thiol-disulfide isomerase/thioredoxin
MKTINLTFLLILFSTISFCQIPDKTISIEDKEFNDYFLDKENIPTVKGKVLNVPEQHIGKVKINYSIVTPFEQRQIKKSCSLNSDGTFELELDYAFPYQQIWISAGRLFYAGIYANSDLFIELDAEILKSKKGVKYNGAGIIYLGSDGNLNNYMNNHVLFKRKKQLELSKEISKVKRDRKMNYEVFISKYDSLYSILQELDKEFMEQNPSDYSWILINERQSDYYADLCVKHWGKEMSPELFDKVKSHKPYLTSNNGMGFYNYLFTYLNINSSKGHKRDYNAYRSYSRISPENISILDSIVLIDGVITNSEPYDTTKYLSLIKQANIFLHDTLVAERTLNTINQLDTEFEQSKSDFLKIKITSTSKDPKDKNIQLATVLNNVQTDWCKTVIKKQYDESIAKLESINKVLEEATPFESNNQLGKPIAEMPFGATMFKVDSIESKQLLANLKSSFDGKALVIDFWATWCSPCLQEMPHSKKLHDDAKELPVEFVYLCTSRSSNLDQWKSKIAEFEISGTHIFVEEDIENELMNLFSVSGFPSYVLIDTNGDYKPGAIKRMSHLNKEKLAELIQ